MQAFETAHNSFPSEVPAWGQLVALGQEQVATDIKTKTRPARVDAGGAAAGASSTVRRGRRQRSFATAIGLAALAASVLLIVRADLDQEKRDILSEPASSQIDRTPTPGEPATRRKGELSLDFYVLRAGRSFEADSRTPLCAGDRLRFSYLVQDTGYFAILNRDGSGAVSAFYSDGVSMAKSDGRTRHLIDESVELDATPGVEEIYAIYCEHNHEVSQLLNELSRRPHTPIFPTDCRQTMWSFPKHSDASSCRGR